MCRFDSCCHRLLYTGSNVYLRWKYFVGIAVSATSAGVDDDKVEPLRVPEGENLTISIHVKKSDEEPQVLVTRLTGSSQEPIAQLICHNRSCERKCWISGVSLMYDRENLTLILVNVSFNQTGRYAVNTLSSTPPQNKIYNLTVCRKYYKSMSYCV